MVSVERPSDGIEPAQIARQKPNERSITFFNAITMFVNAVRLPSK